MIGYRPEVTREGFEMAKTSLGTLPTTTPTLVSEALGRIPEGGVLTVAVSGNCAITIRLWNPSVKRWEIPGSATTDYTKTFAASAASFDYFRGPVGALFHIKSDTGSITGHSNGDAV